MSRLKVARAALIEMLGYWKDETRPGDDKIREIDVVLAAEELIFAAIERESEAPPKPPVHRLCPATPLGALCGCKEDTFMVTTLSSRVTCHLCRRIRTCPRCGRLSGEGGGLCRPCDLELGAEVAANKAVRP